MTHTARSARTAAVLGCALAVALASGCGSATSEELTPLAEQTTAPASEPSASASAEATDDVEQQHTDEAKALLTAYYDELRALGEDGFSDAGRMQRYWSDRTGWYDKVATYDQRRAEGWVAEGGTEIVSTDVVEYDGSVAGAERVTLDVCGDVSTTTMRDGEGNVVERAADVPDRYLTRYVIEHQETDDLWTIADLDADTSRTC